MCAISTHGIESSINAIPFDSPDSVVQAHIKFSSCGRGYIPVRAASNAQILVQDEGFVLLERVLVDFLLRNSVSKINSDYFDSHSIS